MIFQEPKVEFVRIDLTIDASTQSNPAGYETCTGALAPSHNCPQYNVMFWDSTGNEYFPD